MPEHGIQVLTFDADGTIWDFQATMTDTLSISLHDIRTLYPNIADGLTVDDLILHRHEAETAFQGKSMTMEALRFGGFVRTLDAVGIRDEKVARELTNSYLTRRYANARLYPDVFPAFDILADHFRIGLLTNGNSLPDKLGMGDRFAFTVVAQDHGVWKPEQAFYELAVERAGVKPGQILHVGDRFDHDVIPALQAGMQAVWLNREGQDPPTSQISVAIIYSFQDLPAFLGLV